MLVKRSPCQYAQSAAQFAQGPLHVKNESEALALCRAESSNMQPLHPLLKAHIPNNPNQSGSCGAVVAPFDKTWARSLTAKTDLKPIPLPRIDSMRSLPLRPQNVEVCRAFPSSL